MQDSAVLGKQPFSNTTAEAAFVQNTSWFVSIYAPVAYSTMDLQTHQHHKQLLFTQHLLMRCIFAHAGQA